MRSWNAALDSAMALSNPGLRAVFGVLLVGTAIAWDVYRGAASERIAGSETTREFGLRARATELSALVDGNSEFALDAYKLVVGEHPGQNVFFCPYSISVALSMTYAGAGGQTASEIAAVLHSSLPPDHFHRDVGELDLMIASHVTRRVVLESANSLWGSDKIRFEAPFLDTLARNYGAAVHLADFTGDPDASRKRINMWVEDKTHGKIADLLGPSGIDRSSPLVLVNAVYFLGRWEEPFEPGETWPEAFALPSGGSIRVPTMHKGFTAKLTQLDAYDAVELPYVGRSVAMDIIMPKGLSLTAFEAGLTASGFQAIVNGMEPDAIDLSMPRFSLAGGATSLKAVLRGLGMNLGFDPRQANFSAIGIDRSHPLFLGDVLHEAHVTVDEEGTEAAATTASDLEKAAPPPKTKIHIDRPFFFILRDLPTHTILFAGRVTDPSRG